MEKRVFELDGKKYAVKKPTMEQVIKANEIHKATFNEELSKGTLLRAQLEEELRKRKLWSDDREKRYQELRQLVIDNEYKLAKGGIKLSQAKELALEMKRARDEMVQMLSSRTELDSNTCEGLADTARFNFLFCTSLVYEDTGEAVFKGGLDEYLLRQDEEIAVRGATEFYYLMADADGSEEKLPENKFLRRFNFVDDKYRLVDKDGRLIDEDGRHIAEDGRFIKWVSDKKFVYVDSEGRPVTEDNEFDVEQEPFLDDDGNPIEEA